MLQGIRSQILIICVLKCHINISVLLQALRYVVQYKMQYQAFSMLILLHNCYVRNFKARFEKYGISM